MTNRLDEIRPIFAEVLGEAAEVITAETSATDVEGWDSFAHISIVVGVEEKYGVSFTTEDLGKLTCVGDFLDLLQQKLKANAA